LLLGAITIGFVLRAKIEFKLVGETGEGLT
jgi:hypothetical protein